ncbi:MAG: serine-type D-Ala-D-Ala carboxypeptidase/endopeptidase [Thermoanaerobaculia bacterium]|jgi:CubicO group peptidase (beta-lactamase class C family)|nr:serine-type D-Ala-D-Ala carboxypeptidase/endopeptidase [Thermoanaerobaculia bacterium]
MPLGSLPLDERFDFKGDLMKRTTCLAAATLLLARLAFAAKPTDAEIRKTLRDRLNGQTGIGIVVGVIDADGRRIVAEGALDAGDKRPLNGDTVFEIGSISKVFTSLLLADAVQRGEVALTDPVAKFLPPDVKVPERGGKKITLQDLATHTSGLPRLPGNLIPADAANPYADYTAKKLYEFLGSYTLLQAIGSQYEYSNLGGGILGHALARRAGTSYETLLRARITAPLGLKSTTITLSDALKQRLAAGHDENGKRVSNWEPGVLEGMYAIRSTANDLLEFLAAELGYKKSSLAPAMTAQLAVRRPTGAKGLTIALGWHITSMPDGQEIIWHNGGTGGYRTFIGFDSKKKIGVVALTNISTAEGVDDIGMEILAPSTATKVVVVDPKILERYVGRYELAPSFILTITRNGSRLFAQATGQPKFEVAAQDERNFVLKAADVRITFEDDQLILHQNGADRPAKRITGDVPVPKERKEVAVDPAILERYVGRYQLAPTFIIVITREGSHLFLQPTAQAKSEIFAEDDHNFFSKIVDAQITFETDAKGQATNMILHQNGDHPGKRIE